MTTKINKLMEATMAVLQATPERQLKIVVLNKALFYLDLYALRDFGHVITGQAYVALPQGPVVQEYKTVLVGALTKSKLAVQLQTDGDKAKPIRVVKPLERFEYLNASELRLAEKMGASYSTLTSMAVSQFSHANPGWITAHRNYVDGRPAPIINMRLALQQLCDDDDDLWLEAPLDPATAALCESAGAATQPWE
jgi:hypothetical protein